MNCTLRFANGLVLENITEDNGIYASQTEVTTDMLSEEALASVEVVPDVGETKVIRYAKYDTIYKVGEEWHFCLAEASLEEIRARELRTDMETSLNDLLEFVIGGEE